MYRQLTLNQRLTIEELLAKGASRSEIARRLKVHRSTIKREIDRNSLDGVYLAEDAQAVTLCRKRLAGSVAELKRFGKCKPYRGYLPFPPSLTNKERKKKNFRFKPLRYQFRSKRYQDYIPRPDHRPYEEHINYERTVLYQSWKSWYESRYRFRDNALAERRRRPRRRKDFLRYLPNPVWPELRYVMIRERSLRKLRRQEYEIRVRRVERETHEFEQELRAIEIRAIKRQLFLKVEQDKTNRRIRLLLALLLIFRAYELHVLLTAGKARPPT